MGWLVVTITTQEEDGTKPEEELFGVAAAVVEDDRGVGGVRHALVVQHLQVQHEGEHHLRTLMLVHMIIFVDWIFESPPPII